MFHPLELLERLAAIIPRPQINLLIYHGVLAPNAKWHKRAVGYGRPDVDSESGRTDGVSSPGSHETDGPPDRGDATDPPPFEPRNYSWAELMRRTFGFDVMACIKCGGQMRLIAMIEEPAVIAKILDHLGLPTEPPQAHPARPPPERRRGDRPVAPIYVETEFDEPFDETPADF